MFDFIISLIAFILAIGLLVTVHELGHFWVARRAGIKVLRFSVGFGRPLWRYHDKQGTEYVLAAIPLGGYVRMLDEREGPVASHELDRTFNRKPLLHRTAVVAAGPIANFLFAIAAFAVVNLIGIKGLAPIVGEVRPASVAALAGIESGQEIIQVDQHQTGTVQAVVIELLRCLGQDYDFAITLKSSGQDKHTATLNLATISAANTDELLNTLGFSFAQPELTAMIGDVLSDGAAASAGLEPGDIVRAVGQQPVHSWFEFVDAIQQYPAKTVKLTVLRHGEHIRLNITPASQIGEQGSNVGVIGAKLSPDAWPKEMIRFQRYGLVDSFTNAVAHTWKLSVLTLQMIGKMVTGTIDLSGLSGPISIAKGAGQSMQVGSEYYIAFLGLISVSLGVINLLPIPMLDGGHLLYFLVEVVTGRALSQQLQQIGISIGMFVLLFVMGIALYNDFAGLSN